MGLQLAFLSVAPSPTICRQFPRNDSFAVARRYECTVPILVIPGALVNVSLCS